MIRYGPAGIPLSCKGRTLKDGIEDVHNLALSALEVQLVRPRTIARPAEDEEVGLSLNELPPESEFVMGVERDGEFVYDRKQVVEESDNILQLLVPPAPTFTDLPKLGKVAVRHDIVLSSHTPYYMDFTADVKQKTPEGALSTYYMQVLQESAIITDALGGDVVTTNLGPYDERFRSRKTTENNIRKNLDILMDFWQKKKLKPKLGLEISGSEDVFGSPDQIFDLCDEYKGIVPVLNFAHYQSRTGGELETASDFSDVIYEFAEFGKGHVWSSFSNLEINKETLSEKYLTPLKKGDLKFERLAEAIAEINPDMTIISNSPLLEHDAAYMRTLTERVLNKKATKVVKERRKEKAKKEEDEE